jgi:hypothetical protein
MLYLSIKKVNKKDMNIIRMTTEITSIFEVYFEKNQFTVVKEQVSKNTFKYTVLESYDQPLDDDFKSRLVMELENVIG